MLEVLRPLLAVFKEAVRTKSWWDSVDQLATKGVGAVVRLTVELTGPPESHASLDDVILAWAREGWPIAAGEEITFCYLPDLDLRAVSDSV